MERPGTHPVHSKHLRLNPNLTTIYKLIDPSNARVRHFLQAAERGDITGRSFLFGEG